MFYEVKLIRAQGECLGIRGSHPLWLAFPYHSARLVCLMQVHNPRGQVLWFALFRVRGEKDPVRGVKKNLKPCAYKHSKPVNG